MSTKTYFWVVIVAVILLTGIFTGCGDDGPSLLDIPVYPNAIEGEYMSQQGPGGFMGGELEQFSTTDSFDEVLNFYDEALDEFAPELVSNTSELGRQTAFSIRKNTA
jgi:hypothetical protein